MKSNQAADSDALTPRHDDEVAYWRGNFMHQPFYFDGLTFDDYAPALRMGVRRHREDTLFDDVQCRLGAEWEQIKGNSRLSWFEAQHAVRAAWERADVQVLN